nr:hypothetical protein OG461_04725 [Streptomyces sp. NBC_00995]
MTLVRMLSVPAAWKTLSASKSPGRPTEPTAYAVEAPVCAALSGMLVIPGSGEGVHNRCASEDGGQVTGGGSDDDSALLLLQFGR